MKRITLSWNKMFNFVKDKNLNSFNRMALCYPITEFNEGIKTNPFTIFDHQKNYGKKLGYQKEGIQINFDGNYKNMDFSTEQIFIKNNNGISRN